MRKLMLLWAMLAMVLMAVAPAMAQVSQEFEEEDVESGDVEPAVDIASSGDNVNLCVALLQAANTGNVQNEQGVVQYKSEVDDIEFEGSSIEITPEAVQECVQTIEQATAAGAKGEAKAGKAEAKAEAPEAKAGEAEAKAGEAEAKAGGGGGGGGKELPKTGGLADIAPLLGIGAGALLMAGGLIALRIIR